MYAVNAPYSTEYAYFVFPEEAALLRMELEALKSPALFRFLIYIAMKAHTSINDTTTKQSCIGNPWIISYPKKPILQTIAPANMIFKAFFSVMFNLLLPDITLTTKTTQNRANATELNNAAFPPVKSGVCIKDDTTSDTVPFCLIMKTPARTAVTNAAINIMGLNFLIIYANILHFLQKRRITVTQETETVFHCKLVIITPGITDQSRNKQ